MNIFSTTVSPRPPPAIKASESYINSGVTQSLALSVATHVIAIKLHRENNAANLLLDVSLCPDKRSLINFFRVFGYFSLYITKIIKYIQKETST